MENNDIWQLKWKNKKRSKFGLSTVYGLLNKTLNVFSTFLVKVRQILKTPYQILSKCSSFGSGRKWSDNFWKNSPNLLKNAKYMNSTWQRGSVKKLWNIFRNRVEWKLLCKNFHFFTLALFFTATFQAYFNTTVL